MCVCVCVWRAQVCVRMRVGGMVGWLLFSPLPPYLFVCLFGLCVLEWGREYTLHLTLWQEYLQQQQQQSYTRIFLSKKKKTTPPSHDQSKQIRSLQPIEVKAYKDEVPMPSFPWTHSSRAKAKTPALTPDRRRDSPSHVRSLNDSEVPRNWLCRDRHKRGPPSQRARKASELVLSEQPLLLLKGLGSSLYLTLLPVSVSHLGNLPEGGLARSERLASQCLSLSLRGWHTRNRTDARAHEQSRRIPAMVHLRLGCSFVCLLAFCDWSI